MKMIALAACLATLIPLARADALPPPAEVTAVQKALVGLWVQGDCVFPEGLGHACVQRTIAFGNDSYADLSFSGLAYSNEFYGMATSGKWAATGDGKALEITITKPDGTTSQMTVTVESENAITVKDSAYERYPAMHFVRAGQSIKVGK